MVLAVAVVLGVSHIDILETLVGYRDVVRAQVEETLELKK